MSNVMAGMAGSSGADGKGFFDRLRRIRFALFGDRSSLGFATFVGVFASYAYWHYAESPTSANLALIFLFPLALLLLSSPINVIASTAVVGVVFGYGYWSGMPSTMTAQVSFIGGVLYLILRRFGAAYRAAIDSPRRADLNRATFRYAAMQLVVYALSLGFFGYWEYQRHIIETQSVGTAVQAVAVVTTIVVVLAVMSVRRTLNHQVH